MMYIACWREHAHNVLLAKLVVSVVLVVVLGVTGCGSSYGVSAAAEKMRNATRIELVPDAHLFASLTCDASVDISGDQWESMGFPQNATITDANTIRQFAQLVEDIGFERTFSPYPKNVFSMRVIAYRGAETLVFFEINWDSIYVPGLGSFRTKRGGKYVQRELRRVLPYGRRMENVIQRSGDVKFLALTLKVDVLGQGHGFSYVKDRWCDAILEFGSTHVDGTKSYLREHPYAFGFKTDAEVMIRQAKESVAGIEQILAPDANGVRRRPFALNSRYGENPEDDTILLFETEPHWNRVGGPELLSTRFTDPEGCFVYLNDDSVRFIPNDQVERIKGAAEKAAQEGHLLEFRLSTLLRAIGVDEDGGKGRGQTMR